MNTKTIDWLNWSLYLAAAAVLVIVMLSGCQAPSAALINGVSLHGERFHETEVVAIPQPDPETHHLHDGNQHAHPNKPDPQPGHGNDGPPQGGGSADQGSGGSRDKVTRTTQTRRRDPNGWNPGLGFEWSFRKGRWDLLPQVGALVNSYEDLSPYVGGTALWQAYPWLRVGAFAGGSWYEHEDGVVPYAGPTIELGKYLRINYVPDLDQEGGDLWFFQVRLPIGGK